MQLRPYTPADAEATLRVFHDAVHRTASIDYTPEQITAWAPEDIDLAAWDARRRASWTVVAVIDGHVVGFSDLTDDAVLDMLFVHPDAAGRGVARALVDAVLAEARCRSQPRVTARASRTARPAFERLGFTVDGERPHNEVRGVVVPNFDAHIDLLPAAPD